MCMQCLVDSRQIDPDFLPGFILSMSTNDVVAAWPKGHFGLVEENDPMFVFPPIPDPRDEMVFARLHSKLSQEFKFSPLEGHRIILACGRAGWRKRDGSVLWWLMLRVRKWTVGSASSR
jgi:hypothetical protein